MVEKTLTRSSQQRSQLPAARDMNTSIRWHSKQGKARSEDGVLLWKLARMQAGNENMIV